MYTLSGHVHPVYSVDFHPSGNYLATGSFDFNLLIWNMQVGEEEGRQGVQRRRRWGRKKEVGQKEGGGGAERRRRWGRKKEEARQKER